MKKVNFTIELDSDEEILQFENFMKQYVNIIDLVILPDTKELYANDTHFKEMTKKYYSLKKVRNDYINKQLTR